MEFPESFIYAGPAFSAPEQPVSAPYFRRQFRLERVPEQAELLICGIGFYELYVNGQRITRGRLAPYISSPDVAVYYDSYDVTPLLKIGENVLGVWLGNGFQNNPGGYVWDFDKARFRGAPRFALRLDECSGEKRQAILESDKAFLTAPSPLLSDDYRVGETYDARKERPDWLLPGTPSGEWKPALCAERPRGERVLRTIEPVTIEKELRPVSIRKVDDGYLYDFGENNAGVCRLHVTSEAGQTITMHHGEHLIDGKLDLTNLTCDRTTGSQKDVYICKAGENVYTPTFTYHGFQYVWIRGLRPEQATEDALTYLVMHTQAASAARMKRSTGFMKHLCAQHCPISSTFRQTARSARKTAGRQTLRCPQSTHCSISRRSAAIMSGFGISEAHRHQTDRCPVSCRRQAGALRGVTVLRGTACCSGFRMR